LGRLRVQLGDLVLAERGGPAERDILRVAQVLGRVAARAFGGVGSGGGASEALGEAGAVRPRAPGGCLVAAGLGGLTRCAIALGRPQEREGRDGPGRVVVAAEQAGERGRAREGALGLALRRGV